MSPFTLLAVYVQAHPPHHHADDLLARFKIRLTGAFSWAGESLESIQKPNPPYESKTGPSDGFLLPAQKTLPEAVQTALSSVVGLR